MAFAVLVVGLTSFPAQPSRSSEPPSEKAADVSRKVVISIQPEQRSRVYWFLRSIFGNAKGERFGTTQSELWTVPTGHVKRLAFELRLLGSKLIDLPEDWNHLLRRHRDLAMSATQDEMVKQAQGSPGFVGIGMMRAQHAVVAEYALTIGADVPAAAGTTPPKGMVSRIVIPIDDTRQVTVHRAEVVTTAKGTVWRGTIAETGESALLMWWKEGRITGIFAYQGRIYTIVNAGGDVYAVVESDPAKMPPDHAPMTSDNARLRDDDAEAMSETADAAPAAIEPFPDERRRALEAKPITIDLMMLYTKKVASRYLQSPADVIELAVEQANQTFRNSGIGNVSLALVHTQMVDYDETGAEKFDHLFRMVDGIGTFGDVRKLRDQKRADIVGLMLEDPRGCGLSTRVGARAEEAYFVVHHSCAALTISIAHEVGHVLGARHDRSIDKHNAPFPYGHGYVNGSKWRDIMSYHQGCNGCPRIPFWSNPRVSYQGEPTGTVSEGNARVILEQAERVSKFR